MIEGYPTVLFCSAKFSMKDQERTRLLMLSPETSTEKIREGILLRIQKESDRQAFQEFMESNSRRNWLRRRVQEIADSNIHYIVVPEELRAEIADQFFSTHNNLIPRHQRDINRLLAMIKAHALLNLWHREEAGEFGNTVIVNQEDFLEGFRLYNGISAANEMDLPPEMYEIYIHLEPEISEDGVTRKQFQTLYYQTFHRTIVRRGQGRF